MFEHKEKVDKIHSFVQLPHGKNLKLQLDDIYTSLEVIKYDIQEAKTLTSQHASGLGKCVCIYFA